MRIVVCFLLSCFVCQSSFAMTCGEFWQAECPLSLRKFQKMALFGTNGYFGASIRILGHYKDASDAERLIPLLDRAFLDAGHSSGLSALEILAVADTKQVKAAVEVIEQKFFRVDEAAGGQLVLAINGSNKEIKEQAAELIRPHLKGALGDLDSIKWERLLKLNETHLQKTLHKMIKILLDERALYAKLFFKRELIFDPSVVVFLSQPNFPAEMQVRQKFYPIFDRFLLEIRTPRRLKQYRVLIEDDQIEFVP